MAEQLLKGRYSKHYLRKSFAQWPGVLAQFNRIWQQTTKQLRKDDPVLVEIGTYRGISTSIMARYGVVHTYDIEIQPEARRVWRTEGVSDRVYQHKVIERATQGVMPVQFDAAFIDGDHSYEGVASDFEAVSHQARVVVFDDVTVQFPGVVRFINELWRSNAGTLLHYGRFVVLWRDPDEQRHQQAASDDEHDGE